ncbi:MAG: IPT/TIG domain-containing protein [Chloroflexi bacterium]|nr:IPT/TIG domain-containing protein [Chloroflexota bacterium]
MRKYTRLLALAAIVTLIIAVWPAVQAQDSEQQPRTTSVQRVEPRSLQTGVGGNISVYGSGFTEDSVVRLKGVGLLSTTFVNAQALMAVVPGSVPPGEYTVEVRDPVSGDSAWDRTLTITAGPQPTPEPLPTNAPIPTQEPAPLPTPQPGEPRLTARSYNVTPGVIRPGDGLAVTFELFNQGNRTAQSVVARLDPAGKFLPSGGLAALTLPDIQPGGTFLVTLTAIAALDLTGGPNVVSISLTYRDFGGNNYESTATFSVTVEALTQATQLVASGTSTTPNPARPGESVSVELTITNSGTGIARQTLLRLTGTDGVLLAGAEGDSFPIGDLLPGESTTVTAEMIVRTDAKAGPQPQPYTITYLQAAEAKESTGTLTLNIAQVEARSPLLLLDSYEIDADQLAPGDRFTLTATVKNVGNGAADNVLVTFGNVTEEPSSGSGSGGSTTTSSSTFAPLDTGGSFFVGTLDAGTGQATLIQPFIVSGSAKSGIYSLPITLTYPGTDGDPVRTSLSASLIVVVPPALQFNDAPLPPEWNIGEPLSIGVSFTNIGSSDVNFRTVEFTAENADVMDPPSMFLGKIAAGDEGSAFGTVMPTAPGPVTITVTMNYIDEINQPNAIVKTYTTTAVEAPPMPPIDPGFPPIEEPTPEPEPEPTFADMLGRFLLGILGLGS